VKLYLDIETRSRLDVKRYGPYRHAEDAEFRVLMMAWSVPGSRVHVETDPEEMRRLVQEWTTPDWRLVAHNAMFERICLSRLLDLPTGTYLDPRRFRDTMALAGEYGLPQGLAACAAALGAPDKDEAGSRLINLFCKPNKAGGFNDATTHPAQWADFLAYCVQDVETLIEIDRRLPDWPTPMERAVWVADQLANDRGIPADLPMALRAMAAAEQNTLAAKERITELSGVDNPASQPQMMAWAQRVGLDLPNLRAETIEQVLAEGDLDDTEREVLTLRSEVAQAATKKYAAVLDAASPDGRVRGGFRFFGAHTGRWSGRGVQLQNLPRASLSSQAAVDAARCDLALGLGADAYTLKALVRSTFVGPFTVVDYSAIEARVLAWLAGERWALQAFRDGRDIYVETAARMGPQYTRHQGKTATLALGYGSGINGLRVMGAEGSDDDLQEQVDAWRQANRRIVALWGLMGEAVGYGGPVGPLLSIERNGGRMSLKLPSGRAIVYHGLRWEKYVVIDPVTGVAHHKEGWRYADPKRGGSRVGTYGGRLVENATQAVARDLLAEALVRLENAGYPVVGHVHDEVIVEGEHDVEQVAKVMCELPAWAGGLFVSGEGSVMPRYRK
jgi:DNA polymerase